MNRLDTVNGSDIDSFLVSLNETIQWCSRPERGSDPRTSFRSERMDPWLWAKGRKDMVEGATQSRRHGLAKYDKSAATNLAYGRLLIFWPDDTTWDGYTSMLTQGFFTARDEPPWDTWVAYLCETNSEWGDYLVSWIPSDFIDTVSIAVKGSADECIRWLDEQPYLLIFQLLKERGFY